MNKKTVNSSSKEINYYLDRPVNTIIVELQYFDFECLDEKLRGIIKRKNARLIGFYPEAHSWLKEKALKQGFKEVYTSTEFFSRFKDIIGG